MFGITEPDCYGAVDVDTGRCVIFMPRLPDAYAVWMGRLVTGTYNYIARTVPEMATDMKGTI